MDEEITVYRKCTDIICCIAEHFHYSLVNIELVTWSKYLLRGKGFLCIRKLATGTAESFLCFFQSGASRLICVGKRMARPTRILIALETNVSENRFFLLTATRRLFRKKKRY